MIKLKHILKETIEETLKDKLLSIGGKEVSFGRDTDEEIKRMLEDGKLFQNQVVKIKGFANQCHFNTATAYDMSRKDKYKHLDDFKIVSGYALDDDIWISHSWGLNQQNKLVETTPEIFKKYYGYILDPKESQNFCFDNI